MRRAAAAKRKAAAPVVIPDDRSSSPARDSPRVRLLRAEPTPPVQRRRRVELTDNAAVREYHPREPAEAVNRPSRSPSREDGKGKSKGKKGKKGKSKKGDGAKGKAKKGSKDGA